MKAWSRAVFAQSCGRCAAVIGIGEPMFTMSGDRGPAWQVRRCVACAGEPVPSDLPALETRTVVEIAPTRKPKLSTWTRASRSALPREVAGNVAARVRDFKIAQGGSE